MKPSSSTPTFSISTAIGIVLFCYPFVSAYAQRDLSGAAETKLALDRLNNTGSVLMIAAHPDDENTALLAYFSRGRKMRTAYLSLTRGEGGQNLLGPELGDALGLIRTEELLAARKIDGAEQFFTSAIDFGFTKTTEETFSKWGHEKTLGDVVWIIRRFRPDVIILRFSGTPRDGHGQHQVSAIVGKEAFSAAADPKRFPEQLQFVEPWQAKRIVWNTFNFTREQERDSEKMPGRMVVDTGDYDPLLGYSYNEIAGMSRTMHKSQGMGAPERKGSSKQFFSLVAGDPAKDDVFDGIDTTWNRVPGGAKVGEMLAEAARGWDPSHPEKAVPSLLKARAMMAEIHHPLAAIDEAIALCAGIWVEATADGFAFTPASKVQVTSTIVNRGPLEAASPLGKLSANVPLVVKDESAIPASEPYSQPYWLRAPKQGETYQVARQMDVGVATNPAVLTRRYTFAFGAQSIELTRPVVYRYVDHLRGDLRRPLVVVPPVALSLSDKSLVFPEATSKTIEVQVKGSGDGVVRLDAPDGWSVKPQTQPYAIHGEGTQVDLRFEVTPPVAESTAELKASAVAEGRQVAVTTQVIDYAHIPPQYLFSAANAKLVRANIQTLAKRVGYITGAGDDVPEALRQMGVDVTLVTSEDLARGDLRRFDAIVTGVRAYNTRPDLRANQQRLLDYVHDGGTMVVQYNVLEGGFTGGDPKLLDHIGPYPITIGRERVTVEEAPVVFQECPLLAQPNRITAKDFEAWVQERGLYFATEWDAHYQAPFETHDPGEKPLNGATLYVRYGKGAYVFTAFSWFRELPAGVPGAFRIFANLLSAGGAK